MSEFSVCVYGSSSNQIPENYLKAGYELGAAIAEKGWRLVFGGGTTGMMGAVVRGVSAKNGESTGVSPRFFDEAGVLHKECTQFLFTETMRERKAKMEDLSDAFIMTPGGIGTLEEFFEVLTLKQLRQLDKPICILNTDGCFDALNELLHTLVTDRFMSASNLDLYMISDSIDDILSYIENYR